MTKTMQAGNPARTVQVRVDLPLEFFKQLSKAADQRELKVGVLVAGLAQIGASKSAPDSRVRVAFTSQIGRDMLRSRERNRSYQDVAAEFGVSTQTAIRWVRRAEQELRAKALAG